MKKMFCKNWPELKKIQDKMFRIAVCLATNKQVLRGLKKGFPNLFCKEPKTPQDIPLSALRLYMEEHSEESCNQAMDFFGIEYTTFLKEADLENKELPIPKEIREQLSEKRSTDYKIGHKLTWKGESYILVGIKIGSDHNFLHLDSVTIAKASYIDATV